MTRSGARPPMAAAMLTTRDALLGIVVGAIHADGKVVRAEVKEAELHLKGIPSLDITPADVAARLPDVKARLAREGEHALLDACVAALPPDLRVRAFRGVADVIAADAEVLPSEERYLARLATSLAILP